MYTKHRLKLHPQTTLTNAGGLKNLDTRGDGGRVGEIILHIGGSAVAPGKIDMTITSFPVATALFRGPKFGGRQHKLMLRLTGVASNTVPLIEVIISASTAGFGGGQGGSTY